MDGPGMLGARRLDPPLSEYPGMSRYPWTSRDGRDAGGWEARPPCRSIRGCPGIHGHPWMVQGCWAGRLDPPVMQLSVSLVVGTQIGTSTLC